MSMPIQNTQSSTLQSNMQKSSVQGSLNNRPNSAKGKIVKSSLKQNTKIPIRGPVPTPTTSRRVACIRATRTSFYQRRSISMMEFSRGFANISKEKSATLVLGRSNSYQTFSPVASHKIGTEMPETDPRVAGLKIFASIMLNAWRRRREEVLRLSDEISRLKKTAVRTKNQIYVIRSFFRIEQKRNGELRNCLKAAVEDRKKAEDLYRHSNSSLGDSQQHIAQLEKIIDLKNSEFEGMNSLLKETKSEYFAALARERNLDMLLASEQRKIVALENSKNELVEQFHEEKSKAFKEIESLKSLVESKNNEIEKSKILLDSLELRLHNLKCKELQCQEYEKHIALQKDVIKDLTKETIRLKQQIESSLGNRLKKLCFVIPAHTFQCLHIIAYYLLPTMPAPKRLGEGSQAFLLKF